MPAPQLSFAPASDGDRAQIYRLRHAVYAGELHQHAENPAGALCDELDASNVYLAAHAAGALAGFVSITPPGGPRYSMDKYLPRAAWPFLADEDLYEVRLLTVVPAHRNREIAPLLMYAAFRWVEARGGSRIMAIGRQGILDLYYKAGLQPTGRFVKSGAVSFEILHAAIPEIRAKLDQRLLNKLEHHLDWRFDFPFQKPAACFHGGASSGAVGERFEHLGHQAQVITADVLDAWFPPSPLVVAALREHLPWLLRSSPPADASGLVAAIAEARGVRARNILPGAGSSDLIFRALPRWLRRDSRVLLLDPIYSEYPHILEKVIGCRVDRFLLSREDDYAVDLAALAVRLRAGYDLLVLVNPNSPTGRAIPREELAAFLKKVPPQTRVWIDETYIDYFGAGESLESLAATSPNVVVCKSMSKVYALSGARAAYLCASPHQLEELRAHTPPWVVSLPAQVAGVKALQDPAYYSARYAETHRFREKLRRGLESFGWAITPGCANFLLAHLPETGPDAPTLIERCRRQNLFLRNPANMGSRFGDRTVRLAVKDEATNQRMLEIIRQAIGSAAAPTTLENVFESKYALAHA
jgi:histidinol-phosphate/aromatic aminotransferase/cobyric acid decarboxylase-like protein/GNAT superfamily N-acetyltransferase